MLQNSKEIEMESPDAIQYENDPQSRQSGTNKETKNTNSGPELYEPIEAGSRPDNKDNTDDTAVTETNIRGNKIINDYESLDDKAMHHEYAALQS